MSGVLRGSGDRIWVCVPRNKKAQKALAILRNQGVKIRFQFKSINEGKEPETYMIWTKGDKTFEIHSPLSKYLSFSERDPQEKKWKPAFGHSYCRDYAILARFKFFKDPDDREGEFYFHYFIGGIRGLGTWGVGHFIDHYSSKLVRCALDNIEKDGSDNVQMLLEVTYENFRITKVEDVSEREESFFKKRNTEKYIIKKLQDHPDWIKKGVCA